LIVIDASVAVQWVVPEPGYEASASLIRRDDLIAPDLLILEVANAFRRKIAAGEMTQEQAAGASDLRLPVSGHGRGPDCHIRHQ
jgi:predicted nucleic acid-binding protein